jgi:hypothetical protein
MTISTSDNYDATLAQAAEIVMARVPNGAFPKGEREKTIADLLNNSWVEGVTVDAWADAVVARFA